MQRHPSVGGLEAGLRAFERPASLPSPMDVVSPELRDRGRPDLGSVPPELRVVLLPSSVAYLRE
eukprot:8210507-Alexandrium_andersonii.AAC.1